MIGEASPCGLVSLGAIAQVPTGNPWESRRARSRAVLPREALI